MLSRVLLVLVASASALQLGLPASMRSVTRAQSPSMMAAPLIPKGPLGDFRRPGEEDEGWIGDRSQGTQIGKFEKGDDYLFFQGPAPKTAIQEDLPSFFSGDNFADIEITPLQIAVTVTGVASFAAVASVLV
mmetsp:Transcript_41565/g.88702  ORF Transcript_41565/g.88702 Transcript_41565/m.88702 type:complete len:132 (-) Transcript_41565:471-866(-)|eukprot:CAMPEP_0183330784 /NCGR_PEP_ID=MMETSP0164_2-20130417/193_1 /TAXON_ID=221442 /ORGANISM="Coccolithus pelagicus ssp braarudi, Strain PLY182g" /LENGTH=131 /DNA_ID=CAMNT_0025499061 /DNA_START=46 /DNA_END=441 /DNA_ORIENTATION=+